MYVDTGINTPKVERYRQPGLLCTSWNFAQIWKMLGKNYCLVLRLPLRHF
jgi:hypothetical protein